MGFNPSFEMSTQSRGYREWSTVIAEDVASKFSNQIIKSKTIIAVGFPSYNTNLYQLFTYITL